MSAWFPARRRLALYALLAAACTGGLATAVDVTGSAAPWAALYIGVAAAAVVVPAAIAGQVVAGQVLVGRMLLGAGDGPLAPAAATLAGVVITAELLAGVARFDGTFRRRPTGVVERATRAAALGAGAFLLVALSADLPAPTGLLAVAVASAACWLLAGRIRDGGA